MKENVEFENEYFNEKEVENPKKKMISIIFIIVSLVLLIIVITITMVNRGKIDNTLYEAQNSNYEIYCESKAYILNNETVIPYDKNSTIITLAESTRRIAANEVIAMYKTDTYDDNQKKLTELDVKINEKLLALPDAYSNEIVQVENEIDSVIQKIKNTSSYIKINEYKSQLDALSYKKAKITASLNPSGEELLKLIKERDAFKEKMNTSLSNIKATKPGVVIYKTDGLENKFDLKDFNLNKIEQIVKEYSKTNEEVFGIKIVDNFESYIIIEESIDKKGYIKEGYNYQIELIEKDAVVKGELKYIINTQDENKIYCVFRITNGVENLVELRTTDVKVIWKQHTGFWIEKTSMTKENEIDYVTILSLNEYVKIPVKVIVEEENRVLVKNYTKAELQEKEIERKRSLLLYDRVVKNVNLLQK